jgi:hypothetical protein
MLPPMWSTTMISRTSPRKKSSSIRREDDCCIVCAKSSPVRRRADAARQASHKAFEIGLGCWVGSRPIRPSDRCATFDRPREARCQGAVRGPLRRHGSSAAPPQKPPIIFLSVTKRRRTVQGTHAATRRRIRVSTGDAAYLKTRPEKSGSRTKWRFRNVLKDGHVPQWTASERRVRIS